VRKSRFEIRKAKVEDAPTVAAIYNQGIDERLATFNTEHVTVEERREKITKGDDKHPILVASLADSNLVVGWASISPYSTRACYAGIGEVSIYVQKEYRGQGIGKALLQSLIDAAAQQGYWKLIERIFVFNQVSRNLCKELGFREVGIHEKHGKLDGKWIDVVEVERMIPRNII
jgi:L-amino acid N-acyltransferase YncA